MNGVILAAALAIGVSTGWRKLPEGGFEYIVQIEPQALDAMKNGRPVISDLPPALRGVRSYRIIVGTGEVMREGTPPPEQTPASTSPAPPPKPLVPEPTGRPMNVGESEQSAAFFQTAIPQSSPSQVPQAVENEPQKPWASLSLAIVALMGSLSGNLYLGWLTWETRARYRRLLRQSSEDDHIPDRLRLPEESDPMQDCEL